LKKYLIISGLFLTLISFGCGPSGYVFHDVDPAVNFDQYKTYSFLAWTDGNMRTVSESEREELRVALAREIESMGLTYQENDADVKIQITLYFKRSRRHYHHHYGYPGRPNSYMERTLTTDIFEGITKNHIWHSAVVGMAGSNPEKRAEELPEQISRMFEDFPGKKEI